MTKILVVLNSKETIFVMHEYIPMRHYCHCLFDSRLFICIEHTCSSKDYLESVVGEVDYTATGARRFSPLAASRHCDRVFSYLHNLMATFIDCSSTYYIL